MLHPFSWPFEELQILLPGGNKTEIINEKETRYKIAWSASGSG